jgi:hypothetical protein
VTDWHPMEKTIAAWNSLVEKHGANERAFEAAVHTFATMCWEGGTAETWRCAEELMVRLKLMRAKVRRGLATTVAARWGK